MQIFSLSNHVCEQCDMKRKEKKRNSAAKFWSTTCIKIVILTKCLKSAINHIFNIHFINISIYEC